MLILHSLGVYSNFTHSGCKSMSQRMIDKICKIGCQRTLMSFFSLYWIFSLNNQYYCIIYYEVKKVIRNQQNERKEAVHETAHFFFCVDLDISNLFLK